jgi:hypothetical protein
MAALDLCAAEPMMPLGDLLQRLDELESRLRGNAPRAPSAPTPGTPPAPAGAGGGGRSKPPSGQRSWAAPTAPVETAAAPPPPAAPPPAAPASGSETVAETWRRVMAAFEAKGPRLASLLAHAEVVSLSSSELKLSFEGKRDVELAEKARADIEQGVSTTLGRALKVTITVGASSAAALRSEVGTEADAASVDRQNREAEARQHPVIRRTQDLFGAALKEIKTP